MPFNQPYHGIYRYPLPGPGSQEHYPQAGAAAPLEKLQAKKPPLQRTMSTIQSIPGILAMNHPEKWRTMGGDVLIVGGDNR